MSEDGWAARWGLMLMGELKLSTQTLRGQNCRSVFLMLTTPSQNHGCKSAFSIGGRGSEEKMRIFSFFLFYPFPAPPLPQFFCTLSVSFPPVYNPFPLQFPDFGFPSGPEGMVLACEAFKRKSQVSPTRPGWEWVGGIVVRLVGWQLSVTSVYLPSTLFSDGGNSSSFLPAQEGEGKKQGIGCWELREV